jgi:hypothetical protein
MKKIIFRLFLGIVLLLVIAVVVVFFSLNSIVKKGVETVGPEITKVKVTLGAADISPLSGSGKLTKLVVGNPDGYKTPSAMEFGSIKVGVKLGSVLSDTIIVNEINIQAPEITLEGTLTGNNLSKIMDNLSSSSSGDTSAKTTNAPADKSNKPGKKLIIKDLVIQDGKINLSVSSPLGGKSMTVPLPTLHLQNIGEQSGGVTAADAMKQIMQPLLASVVKSAEQAIESGVKGLQDIGKGGTGQLTNVVKGVGDLFKK